MKITKKVVMIAVATGMFVAAGGYYVIAGLGTAPGGMTTGTASGDINKGLVLHMPLDQESLQSATTFADKTPNENVGTKYGSVLEFDDADSNYVRVADSASLDITGSAITMSSWVKIDDYSTRAAMIDKFTLSTAGYMFRVYDGGKFEIYYYDGVGDRTLINSEYADTFLTDTWYNVVATIDSGTIRLYVNSALIHTKVAGGGNIGTSSGIDLEIGKYSAQGYDGSIGDTRIYSRALTAAEVLTMYQGGVVSDTDLEAHWKMKDASSTTLTDETANSNDGTLTNFADTTAAYGNTHDSGWVTNDTPNVFASDYKGQSNRAMSFDGASDSIDCGDSPELRFGTGDFSVSVWVNLKERLASHYPVIVGKGTIALTEWMLRFNPTSIEVYGGSQSIANTAYPDGYYNLWTHIVFVRDGDDGKMYIDSTLGATTAGIAALNFSTGKTLTIGCADLLANRYLTGDIADVRIYNRALSTTEITSLYTTYRPKIVINDLNKGLVLHQPLDIESLQSATTFADKTPNENVGTKYGSVLKFDDADSNYVSVADSASLDITGSAITMSSWVKIDDYSTRAAMIDKFTLSTAGYMFRVYDGGKFEIYYYDGVGDRTLINSEYADTFLTDTWYNVVATIDSGTIRLYVNSALIHTKVAGGGNIGTSSGIDLEIGKYSAQGYDGSIGDTRIYSRALTAAEVLTMYQGGVVSDTDLEAHWKMKDASSTTLTDETANSNDGTLTNFADTTAAYGNTHDSGWVTNDTPNVFASDYKGQSNRAMSFDGASDYIDCGDSPELRFGTGDFSVSVWVNLKERLADHYPVIVGKGTIALTEWMLRFNPTSIEVYGGSQSIANTAYPDGYYNLWTHIVFVRDGDDGKMYIDSTLGATTAGIAALNFSTGKTLTIGCADLLANRYLTGDIADVRIYNRALSTTEITSLYEQYRPKIVVNKRCPANYILVPGNATYGTTEFCVMKYEASNVGGVATSDTVTTPWISITQTAAITACTNIGGHLITNDEWMTIARNVEQVDANWTGGSVGSGVLERGNVGNAATGNYDGADPEFGTGRNALAELALDNGETIWDISGNVWEWTNDAISCATDVCTSTEMPYDSSPNSEWVEFTALAGYGSLSYDDIRPSDASWNSADGMGKIYTDVNAASPSGTVHAFLRGGYWYDGALAGAFTLYLDNAPANSNTDVGFRCAW